MNMYLLKILFGLLVGGAIVFGTVYLLGNTTINLDVDTDENSPEDTELKEQVDSLSSEGLLNTPWVWLKTETNMGETVTAPENDKFIMTFHEDGTMTTTTDCNSMFSSYVLESEALTFGEFGQTQMYCEGSLESEYAQFLSNTHSYSLVKKELHLLLSEEVGKMIFVKRI
jgi:heat shock protein HslJ